MLEFGSYLSHGLSLIKNIEKPRLRPKSISEGKNSFLNRRRMKNSTLGEVLSLRVLMPSLRPSPKRSRSMKEAFCLVSSPKGPK